MNCAVERGLCPYCGKDCKPQVDVDYRNYQTFPAILDSDGFPVPDYGNQISESWPERDGVFYWYCPDCGSELTMEEVRAIIQAGGGHNE